ncbi:hypothetical protein NLI96_g8255 [Meripilus lineatus]|uniref:Uncharacterized protein n=1 Tax=Meripilus lineatus TaxID=2056292 RepID=A0AAD5UZJ0_9APHY|nr:hypothetical protein NLI96_g8255 [Physisporinus lineatus]
MPVQSTTTRPNGTKLVAGLRNFLSVAITGTSSRSSSSSSSSYEALSRWSQSGTLSSVPTSPNESLSGECGFLLEDSEYAPIPMDSSKSGSEAGDRNSEGPLLDQIAGDLLGTPITTSLACLMDTESSLLLENFPSPIARETAPPKHKHPVWKYESPHIDRPPGSRLAVSSSSEVVKDFKGPVQEQKQHSPGYQGIHKTPVILATHLADSPSPLLLSSAFSALAVSDDGINQGLSSITLQKYGGSSDSVPLCAEGFGLGISVATPLLSG